MPSGFSAAWHVQSDTDYRPGTLLVQVPLPLPRNSVNEQACGKAGSPARHDRIQRSLPSMRSGSR